MWKRQGLPEEIADIYRDLCMTDLVLSDFVLTSDLACCSCYPYCGDHDIEALAWGHRTSGWAARI